MTDATDSALREAIDRIAIDYHNEAYESCLRRCSTLLVDDAQSLSERVKQSLYVFMRECCGFLLERASAPSGQPSCSFCGKSPPEIRLGAGPGVFICNECVDIFADIFNEASAS